MKLKVFNSDGSSAAEKEFPIPQFEGDKGLQALKQVILSVQANQRQGSVSTKTRSTVHGTGKKPFRQKGTGSARQGSKVAPNHYHGSVAHGPQPRDFNQHINKKMKKLALSRALFDRVVDGDVSVIEKWEIAERKTKLMHEILCKVAPAGKLLILDDSWSDNSLLAARNINRVEINEADDVNAFDLSAYDQVIVSQKGMERLLARMNGGN